MAVITFLVIVGIIVGVMIAMVILPSLLGRIRNHNEVKELRTNLRTAKVALRHIASDAAGNPTLEAQLALEEIEGREYKELN